MHTPIDPQLPVIPALPAERPNPDVVPPPIGDPLPQPLPGEQRDPLLNPWPELKEPRRSEREELLDGYAGPAEDDERFASIEPYQ